MGATETEFEQPSGGGLQTAKDLFSGAVGGIAQVLIGEYETLVRRPGRSSTHPKEAQGSVALTTES
jgi:hypothetical protein